MEIVGGNPPLSSSCPFHAILYYVEKIFIDYKGNKIKVMLCFFRNPIDVYIKVRNSIKGITKL
jgi:hypothetical protein